MPFAGVARAGFVAIQILRSFVDENIISQDNYDKFLNSLNTVSKQLSKDIKNLTKKEFLEIYGHLRPEHMTYYLQDMMKRTMFILKVKIIIMTIKIRYFLFQKYKKIKLMI